MPTLQRLADNGLTYSQWHTTALCSPTRSTFLTGRNHHQNGFATISEIVDRLPRLQLAHPARERDDGERPARRRLEHVLGRQEPQRPGRRVDDGRVEEELAARAGLRPLLRLHRRRDEQLVSDLAEDNHYIDQPYPPEDGYHLSKDLADQALSSSATRSRPSPDKPWYLWFCPGANHAPHHAPAGVHRQVQGQVRRRLRGLPRVGAAAHDRARDPARGHRAHADQPDARRAPSAQADCVRPWDELSTRRSGCSRRMAEVYAGFSEYTDAQVGRIVDYLEESGQLENTLILYCADNGASGEGSPNGSVNEGKFFGGYPGRPRAEPGDGRQARQPGRPTTTTRPAGRWRSRRRSGCSSATRYQGGVCDPLVIHWPAGIKAKGEVRAPVPPLAPTSSRRSSTCCGVEMPEVVQRREADAARRACRCATRSTTRTRRRSKETQYYEMLGTRGIWHEGWKAVTEHGPISGMGNFDERPLAALPHRRGPLRGARPRRRASREGRGAEGALARGGEG